MNLKITGLHLKVRLKIAEKIRAKSRQDKQYKPTKIMDVNADFVLQIFHKFNVTQIFLPGVRVIFKKVVIAYE